MHAMTCSAARTIRIDALAQRTGVCEPRATAVRMPRLPA
ncbi:hypothetical protein L810_8790 [Burkholderia sp. AU4i]|nr:hypothetical protein L810_8790 [Burkholderia sp. AU4i]